MGKIISTEYIIDVTVKYSGNTVHHSTFNMSINGDNIAIADNLQNKIAQVPSDFESTAKHLLAYAGQGELVLQAYNDPTLIPLIRNL